MTEKCNTKKQYYGFRSSEVTEEDLMLLLAAHPSENTTTLLKRLIREAAMRVRRMKHPSKVILLPSSDGTWNVKIQCCLDRDELIYCGWVSNGKEISLDLHELLDGPFAEDIKQIFRVTKERELEELLHFEIQMLLPH